MAQEWELSVSVEIDDPVVSVTCTNTLKDFVANTWTRPFEHVQLVLADLSEEVKQALGFAEE